MPAAAPDAPSSSMISTLREMHERDEEEARKSGEFKAIGTGTNGDETLARLSRLERETELLRRETGILRSVLLAHGIEVPE